MQYMHLVTVVDPCGIIGCFTDKIPVDFYHQHLECKVLDSQ